MPCRRRLALTWSVAYSLAAWKGVICTLIGSLGMLLVMQSSNISNARAPSTGTVKRLRYARLLISATVLKAWSCDL